MNEGGMVSDERMLRLNSQAGGQEENQIHGCSEGGNEMKRGFRGQVYMEG